jgi:AraC-like DNA-binding protein
MRAAERRLRRWTGQNQQALSFYARFEELHRLSLQNGDAPLAGLAQDAGFSDQSHMGRTVRRATGYSPARLNELIATEESFWCYRLLGERY